MGVLPVTAGLEQLFKKGIDPEQFGIQGLSMALGYQISSPNMQAF